jgi:hypothetical protein
MPRGSNDLTYNVQAKMRSPMRSQTLPGSFKRVILNKSDQVALTRFAIEKAMAFTAE